MADRYVVERTLGRGGMATVYLAHDTMLDRPVVLKVLAEHLADDPEFRGRFLREARLAARLVHPNIVQVYDVGEDERGPFIVMEYVDGETLADELRRRGRLPPSEVVAIGVQLCSALAAAHAAQLVHRDIKPQNILRTADGKVKLADFGIARSLEGTRHTEVGTVLGTAVYLAPEQARGDEVTAAADIYSVGVVLYELLTGTTPFDADTLTQLAALREQGVTRSPRDLVPEVPVSLEAVVMRCLALRPEYRPESAAGIANELVPTETGVTAVLPTTPPRGRSRRRPLLLAGATLVIVAAVVIAAVLASSGGSGPKAAATATAKTHKPAATTRHTVARTTPTTTAAVTPTPPATPEQAIGAVRDAIVSALGSGDIDPHAAADLQHRVDDIARSGGGGDEGNGQGNGKGHGHDHGHDAAKKVDDLESRLNDLVEQGRLTSTGLAEIAPAVGNLAATLNSGSDQS